MLAASAEAAIEKSVGIQILQPLSLRNLGWAFPFCQGVKTRLALGLKFLFAFWSTDAGIPLELDLKAPNWHL